MVMRTLTVIGACLAFLASGCAVYQQQEPGKRCTENAECNPFDRCGPMPSCVSGRCNSDKLVTLPCRQGCSSDSDCVLVSRGCCCGSTSADYLAVLATSAMAWNSRSECGDAVCTGEECALPPQVSAVCESGSCRMEYFSSDWQKCLTADDCVHVPIGCPSCDCHAGYLEGAINRFFEADYLEKLENDCAAMGACAPGPYANEACTNRPGICVSGHCEILSQDCDCPFVWDPVCVTYRGQNISLPNECHAACLGLEYSYHGRCECQAACLDPDPVCASNGETYWCGAAEAVCSGNQVSYSGDCDSSCDYCLELERPPIPVCTEDFQDYTDICYTECHGQSYWHRGACLPGEGDDCDNGWDRVECPSQDLYCLNDDYCPDCPGCQCPGICIALGHCQQADDCRNQPLSADDCDGRWTCQAHSCIWECS